MNSILATEKGLPPGLWLPTAVEPTERYLSENFVHKHHEYEDIIDYGAFVVALIALEAKNTQRVSMMPVSDDIEAMYSVGYGMSLNYLQTNYGGMRKLQSELGYFPRCLYPTTDELLNRYKWIREYAFKQDGSDTTKLQTINDILRWGADRDLAPAPSKVYKILNGDVSPLLKIFGIEKPSRKHRYSTHYLYRFGARVIKENGRPLSQKALDEMYGSEFTGSPFETIRNTFGTYSKFWLEFDFSPSDSVLTEQDIANLGVRWAIANQRTNIKRGTIERLSHEMKFPSRATIRRRFGSMSAFRDRITNAYEAYLRLKSELISSGVSDDAFNISCKKFDASPEFVTWLKGNKDVLVTLSDGSIGANYVLRIMQTGFNLDDEVIFNMQYEDVQAALKRLRVTSNTDKRFVFDLIPRINAQEILGL